MRLQNAKMIDRCLFGIKHWYLKSCSTPRPYFNFTLLFNDLNIKYYINIKCGLINCCIIIAAKFSLYSSCIILIIYTLQQFMFLFVSHIHSYSIIFFIIYLTLLLVVPYSCYSSTQIYILLSISANLHA